MADARETFYPVEIQRDYQGKMRVLWDDGHECLYPYNQLRKVCPCATCRELRGQQQQAPANPFQVVTTVTTQDVHPVLLSAVGNYALHIEWSDGHRRGFIPGTCCALSVRNYDRRRRLPHSLLSRCQRAGGTAIACRISYAGFLCIKPARRTRATSSCRWLIARCSKKTTPASGRERDSRLSTISVST